MKKVLLIDDDEDDRDFFLSVVGAIDRSFKCEVAENGEAAVRYLVHEQMKPDLIFLDLNMPVMNGRQFLTEIRKYDKLKNIPVIVLSTSSDVETISEAQRLGATDFITKPNKISLLEKRLREVLVKY